MGVIYVKEDQFTEEQILDNNEPSPHFEEFLQVLGEKVRLKGKFFMKETLGVCSPTQFSQVLRQYLYILW